MGEKKTLLKAIDEIVNALSELDENARSRAVRRRVRTPWHRRDGP
jgi:hypothetical protein